MTRSQRAWQLAGETVREVGTLTFVFAPLDGALSEPKLPAAVLAFAMLAGLLMITGGILLETRE